MALIGLQAIDPTNLTLLRQNSLERKRLLSLWLSRRAILADVSHIARVSANFTPRSISLIAILTLVTARARKPKELPGSGAVSRSRGRADIRKGP